MAREKFSRKPSKQRKRLFKAPLHRRRKIMASHLSPELREKYGIRSFPVRMGDTVKIMRGDARGLEGKVSRVDRKTYRIYVEGVTRRKQSGETVMIPIHHSKVMIMSLDTSDPKRRDKLESLREAKEAL